MVMAPTTLNPCAAESPSGPLKSQVSPEAARIPTQLMKLEAASTSPRFESSARSWMKVCSGRLNTPAETPKPTMMTRLAARLPGTACSRTGARVRPVAPSGTMPNSTSLPESFAARSDPMPMPKAAARNR